MTTLVTVRRAPRVTVACPSCGDGVVTTARAGPADPLPRGWRWVGVPCSRCAKTFTFTAVPEELPA